MRGLRNLTLTLLLTVSVPALAETPLALKRVLLSTGGVAYLEHEAQVTGDATLSLDVRLDQVDDVLKSLIVYDDAGRVAGMVLPGREPLQQQFRDLPFPAAALADPAALLGALRGAVVQVEGPTPLTGQIMSARQEQVTDPEGRQLTTRHRVTLATADGLRQFVLEEATAIAFEDARLAAQVREALAAMLAHGARDRRQIDIRSRGHGERMLRVGYVVAAPLWKAAYRLSLDAGPKAERGLLQGWAVLENMTGQDWQGIELILASGSPVTFRQALYEAYYVDRPDVPVEVFGRVLPPPDAGGVPIPEVAQREEGRALRKQGPRAMAESLAALADRSGFAAAPPPGVAPSAIAASSEEAATQVLFQVSEPVSVEAGQSLSVPVIDRRVAASPISLYQPETHSRHPLASVRLKNETDAALPPGVLTLYQAGATGAAYVGDARLAPLPAGEERLLSFAVDTKTKVDREVDTASSLLRGSIARGVLRLVRSEKQTTTYTIAAPAQEPRRLIIEHDRMPGWELAAPAADTVERTETDYRLPLELKAGEVETLTVVLQRQTGETLRLLDLDDEQIRFYANARELSPELRQAFERLATLKRAIEAPADRLERLEQERQRLFEDQERIRANMGRVSNGSDLHRRYLEKLQAQESRLEQIADGIEQAQQEVQAARDALTTYVDGLTL